MIKFNKEQVYIVTGASSGIGEAVAKQLNELGATVVGIARNEERLLNVKKSCKFPENLHIEIKDLTENIEGLPQYVKSLKEKYGKFSGMAYCAGISMVNSFQLLEYSDYMNLFKIGYFAPMLMTKGIVDRRNNIGKGFSLVFISSIDVILSTKGQTAYAGMKAALSASARTISKEVSRYGMRINSVLPSMIKTPMTIVEGQSILNISEESQANLYPFGWGEPQDVSSMVVFLLSDKAKFISGQNYVIDSGGIL